MSTWGLFEVFDLEYLGEEWKGCSITIKAIPYPIISGFVTLDSAALKENPDKYIANEKKLMETFKTNFKEGKLFNGDKTVPMVSSDFNTMPSRILMDLMSFLFQASERGAKAKKNLQNMEKP